MSPSSQRRFHAGGRRPPGRRRLAGTLIVPLLCGLAAACSGGGQAGSPVRCGGPLVTLPSAGIPGRAALARTVGAYLRALSAHRPAGRYEAPATATARCSLDALASGLRRIPISRLDVVTAPVLTGGGRAETVEVTLTARLLPGGAWIALGQRVLQVASVGGRTVVRADVTGGAVVGAASDGLAAVPTAGYRVGWHAVVVSADGSPEQAAAAAEVAARVWPQLAQRFGTAPRPVIVIVPGWSVAERVADVPVARWEAGVELGGLVLLVAPAWWCCGSAAAEGTVVHELTHVVTARQVAGTPVSLVEGIARLEEERYDAAAGRPYPQAALAAAYRRGWSSVTPWRQLGSLWYQVPGGELELRYLDGAAVLRVVEADAGRSGLVRLERSLRAQARHTSTGLLSVAQLDGAFEAATGRTFAAVVGQAHRLVLSGSADRRFP